MKFGVIVFPGSNCDRDPIHVLEEVLNQEVKVLWHKDRSLDDFDMKDCILLPGGFSYGDYLRPGAIARFSPIMGAVERFAADGGLVIGICNGFQILCEAGLLPGALIRNRDLQFICEHVNVRVERTDTPFTVGCVPSQVLSMPIAHGEGNYFCDQTTLAALEGEGRVVFRYCD